MSKARPKIIFDDEVSSHIEKLDKSVKQTVELIREKILETSEEISERIKWNNPSFYFNAEIKQFNPKEYKREIAVFNLFKNRVMLVLPSGAKLLDPDKILEGDYKDGRRLIVFKNLEDAKQKSKSLQALITQWLSLVERE